MPNESFFPIITKQCFNCKSKFMFAVNPEDGPLQSLDINLCHHCMTLPIAHAFLPTGPPLERGFKRWQTLLRAGIAAG